MEQSLNSPSYAVYLSRGQKCHENSKVSKHSSKRFESVYLLSYTAPKLFEVVVFSMSIEESLKSIKFFCQRQIVLNIIKTSYTSVDLALQRLQKKYIM